MFALGIDNRMRRRIVLALVLFCALAPAILMATQLEASPLAPAAPVLDIGIGHSPLIVRPGNNLEYTIVISNIGTTAATGVMVTDVMPANTTFVSAGFTNGSGSITAPAPGANGTIVWTVSSPINPNTILQLQLVVRVNFPLDNATLLDDFAAFSADGGLSGEIHEFVAVAARPILNFEKSATPPSGSNVLIGDVVAYTLVVSNSGDMNATGVVVSDVVPANTTYLPGSIRGPGANDTNPSAMFWNVGTLPVTSISGTVALNFSVSINPFLANGTVITNTGVISSNQTRPQPSNPVTHTVLAPVLNLSKSVIPPSGSAVRAGDVLSYTLLLSNSGGAAATGVVVRDSVPANTTYVPGSISGPGADDSGVPTLRWNVGTLPVASTVTLGFRVSVNLSVISGTIITNFGVVSSIQTPPTSTVPVTNVVSPPQLNLVKSAVPPSGSLVTSGSVVTYTLLLSNIGGSMATGVVVSDVVPANTTYVPGSIRGPGADESGAPTLRWNIGTLPVAGAGGSVAVSFSVRINPGLANGTVITNRGFVSSNETGQQPSNSVTHIVVVPRVSIFKEDATIPEFKVIGPNKIYLPLVSNASLSQPLSMPVDREQPAAPTRPDINAGDLITYHVAISNTGGLTLTNVVITDTIDPLALLIPNTIRTSKGTILFDATHITITVGTLVPGEMVDVYFVVHTILALPCGAQIHNQAFVSSSELPTAPSNVVVVGGTGVCHPKGIKVDPSTNRVWVASRDSNEVFVFDDGPPLTLAQRIGVGRAPFNIAIVPARHRAYVTNYGSYTNTFDSQHAPSISVVDTSNPASYRVIRTISLPSNSAPAYIVSNDTTGRVYAAIYGTNEVRVIDSAIDDVVAIIPMSGGSGTFGIAANPNIDRVYATNRGGTVYVIDGETNAVTEIINERPNGGIFSPFVATVNTANNRLYVTFATDPGFMNPNQVAVYDTSREGTSALTEIPVGNGAEGGIAVNTLRNCIYVTNSADNTVSVINSVTNLLVATVIGFANPFGIDANPARAAIYVGNRGSNAVIRLTDPCP